MVTNPLIKVLIIEDSEDDALLIVREIKKAGFSVDWKCIDNKKDLEIETSQKAWDIIITDYEIPGFSGMEAIDLVKNKNFDTPVIMVSGKIGEEAAVEAMKAGAYDYIVKGNFSRLVPAIKRELNDAAVRKDKIRAEMELSKSEDRYKLLVETMNDGLGVINNEGKIVYANNSLCKIIGRPINELVGKIITAFMDKPNQLILNNQMPKKGKGHGEIFEIEWIKKDGKKVSTLISPQPLFDDNDNIDGNIAVITDITWRKETEIALHKRATRLELISLIGQKSTAILDLNEMLLQAVNLISKTLNYFSVAILLIEKQNLILKASTNTLSDSLIGQLKIPVGEKGIVGWVAANNKPLLVPDVNKESRYLSVKNDTRINSELAVPIKLKEKVIGVLDVQSENYNAFTQGDQYTLQTIADQLATTIDNVRLYEAAQLEIKERKRSQEIRDIIYNISNAVTATEDIGELYKIMQKELGQIIDTTNFLIGMYNQKENTISIPYMKDKKDYFETVSAENTLSNIVIQTKKPLLVNEKEIWDLKNEGRIDFVGTLSKTWLGVPLVINKKIFGVLVIQDYNKTNAYSQEDLKLIEFISSQISVSIYKKQIQDEIRKLSRSVEQSPASVIITNVLGEIEYTNPKFNKITGYSLEEVIGKNPRILKSTSKPQSEYKKLWETITSGNEWRGEFLNVKKNGELFWESASISSIKNTDGKITHFLAVKEDITQRKTIEKDLIQAKEKAEESDRLKSNFLSNMSHEIRTPMNGILGFSQLLKRQNLTPEQREEYTDIINYNSKKLLNIIDDIIDISIIESKQVKIEQDQICINMLLSNLHSRFKTELDKIEKTDIEFNVALTLDDDKSIIYSDENKLVKVISNLLDNSIKFTDKGKIEFGYTLENNMIRFFIKDTGVGIPQDKHEIVFDRFRQADDSHTRKYGGTGLGLSIAKTLINLMGGKIWLKSKSIEEEDENSGSVFYFTIPYQPVHKVEKEPVDTITEKSKYLWNDKNILIVEDDMISFYYLEAALAHTNAQLIHAKKGEEAVKICKTNSKIDLILMDIQLPGMDGYEATKIIRQSQKDLPVIAQTAHALVEDRNKCFKVGCNDYLTKPINQDILLSTIDKYL